MVALPVKTGNTAFAMALCLLSRPLNEHIPDLPVVDKALLQRGSLDHPLRVRGIAREVGTDDIDDADIAIMHIGAVGIECAPMIAVLELVEQVAPADHHAAIDEVHPPAIPHPERLQCRASDQIVEPAFERIER